VDSDKSLVFTGEKVNFSVFGTVTNQLGSPIEGIMVGINGTRHMAKSSFEGVFEIPSLPPNSI